MDIKHLKFNSATLPAVLFSTQLKYDHKFLQMPNLNNTTTDSKTLLNGKT